MIMIIIIRQQMTKLPMLRKIIGAINENQESTSLQRKLNVMHSIHETERHNETESENENKICEERGVHFVNNVGLQRVQFHPTDWLKWILN